jgi:hypothetical protein
MVPGNNFRNDLYYADGQQVRIAAVNEQRASSRQMRRKHFGFQALALRADMLAFFRWKIPQLDIIDFWPIRTARIQMPF